MKIKFSTQEVEEIIKKYYQEKTGEEIEVEMMPRIKYDCFTANGYASASIILRYFKTIAGKKLSVEDSLSLNELIGIYTDILNKEGYELMNLYYNCEMTSTGYGTSEHIVPQLYGIIVDINEKERGKKYENQKLKNL